MNLYIIGNGFDLFHNMKTKFEDFRDFLSNKDLPFFEEFENLFWITNSKIDFERFNSNHFSNEIQIKEWKNLEEILGNWEIEDIEYSIATEIQDIEELDGGFCEGIKLPTSGKYYNDFFDTFHNYFYQWINQNNNNFKNYDLCEKINNKFKFNIEKDLFFSFNYTKILENFYNIKQKNICHIHGICNDESSIILGCHKNEHVKYNYEDDGNYLNRNQFLEKYKKKLTATINETISSKVLKNYQQQLDENKDFFCKIKKSHIKEIIVIGHSVNEIDLNYYKEIHKLAKNADWKIYFFNEENILLITERLKNIGINKENIKYRELPKL